MLKPLSYSDKTKMKKRVFMLALAAISCCLAMPLSAHQGATGIVKERMDAFSKSRSQMREMGRALQNNQFEVMGRISADMQIWAKEIVNAFPEGSQIPPSEASDSIWDDKAGFAKAAFLYESSLINLDQASFTNEREAVVSAYRAVGQACQSCHDSYRQK